MMRQSFRWSGLVAALVLAAGLRAPAASDARIEIDRQEAVVGRREFDPSRPPAEMPPLKGSEAAQCSSNFTCSANSSLSVTIQPARAGGQVTAEVIITRVQVSVGLSITIWLPHDPAKKLVDHEEGHRKILERVYATADAVAREEAGRILGQKVTATAAGEAAAAEAAQARAKELLQTLNDRYMQRVANHASAVNDTYDLLTAHGTRLKPNEAQAIEQAFARHPAPATASSTTRITEHRP